MSGLLIVIGIRTKSVNRYDFVPTMFLAPFFSVIYIYIYMYIQCCILPAGSVVKKMGTGARS